MLVVKKVSPHLLGLTFIFVVCYGQSYNYYQKLQEFFESPKHWLGLFGTNRVIMYIICKLKMDSLLAK